MSNLFRPASAPVLAMLFLAGFSPAARASLIVIPNSLATTRGNDTNCTSCVSSLDIHLQGLYSKSQFPSGLLQIDQIAFRAAPGSGPLNFPFGNLTLSLS